MRTARTSPVVKRHSSDKVNPMNELVSIALRRDCAAVEIPAGRTVTLAAGTLVDITQSLGGHYTVRTPAGLFRIGAADADALGQNTDQTDPGGATPVPPANREALEQRLWETLKSCYDPEIPVNIVDLGLIYDLRVEPADEGRHRVAVKMTLTAPGCGMGGVIAGDAQHKLMALPEVAEAVVEVVWDPPWHQSMITPEGRRVLGLE
jgi:probable FeS assembly SUF system protein SufT